MKKFLFILGSFTTMSLFAQPGALDLSFSDDGKVSTDFMGSIDYGFSIAIQPDGKILFGGYGNTGFQYDFALARYLIDGSLDTTFDFDGKVTSDFLGYSDYGYSIAIQADGKILIGGSCGDSIGLDFAITRYNPNGSIDSTFNNDGRVITDVGTDNDIGNSIAIQNDGKIVVAGYAKDGATNVYDIALTRYKDNGTIDSTFDLDGIVITDLSSVDVAYGVAIQNDGKILVAGNSINLPNYDFTLIRYNTDGSLDSSFDSDGIAYADFGSTDYGKSIVIQNDGKILVAGHSSSGSLSDFEIARFNSDGSLDLSFDLDGKVTTDFNNDRDEANSIALQNDGKIVVTGSCKNLANYDFGVARYNTDGSLDNTFGFGGKITTDMSGPGDNATSIAIQGDGKIVLGGYAKPNFVMCRYNLTPWLKDIEGVAEHSSVVSVYPNPFISNFMIVSSIELKDAQLNVFDVTGKNVLSILEINGFSLIIPRNNLSSGMYFYRLTQNNRVVGNGKLIAE